jgi:hypothetical protein
MVQERFDVQLHIQFVTSFAFHDWEMSKDADVVKLYTERYILVCSILFVVGVHCLNLRWDV